MRLIALEHMSTERNTLALVPRCATPGAEREKLSRRGQRGLRSRQQRYLDVQPHSVASLYAIQTECANLQPRSRRCSSCSSVCNPAPSSQWRSTIDCSSPRRWRVLGVPSFGGGGALGAAEKATTSNASVSTRSAPSMVIGCDTTAECVSEFNNQDLECFSDAAACPAKPGNQCSRPKQCDTNAACPTNRTCCVLPILGGHYCPADQICTAPGCKARSCVGWPASPTTTLMRGWSSSRCFRCWLSALSSAYAARGRRLLAKLGNRFNRSTRKAAPPR